MNFRTTAVEGQIARWLEYLASYDFKVLFRSGASHQNADSMSRRPCVAENCEYCNRIDKRYTYEDPELATRAAGEYLESIAKGESTEKDGLSRQLTSILDELVSPDGQRGNSKSSVKVHIHDLSYGESIPDRSNKGGIRKYTLPGFTESQKSLHINHGKVTVSSHAGTLEFDSTEKNLDSQEHADTAIAVTFNTGPPVSEFILEEGNVALCSGRRSIVDSEIKVSCIIERSDCSDGDAWLGNCSLDGPTVSEKGEVEVGNVVLCSGRRSIGERSETEVSCIIERSDCSNGDVWQDESEDKLYTGQAAATNSTKTIEIDCLVPENIKLEQDKDPVISQIKLWKMEGEKPKWQVVAEHGPELKVYWSMWATLKASNDTLHKQSLDSATGEHYNRIILPASLRKTAFVLLHENIASGHLGQEKTLTRIKQRFYWYKYQEDVEYWCRNCDICASRKPPYRKAKAPMRQYNVGYPLERVAIDRWDH